MYKALLKPILFLFPAERAHSITVTTFRLVLKIPLATLIFRKLFSIHHEQLERQLMGLHFSNPVGLAAGFDKDGKYYKSMDTLGFGFIELGTVTPRPQKGNPKPRLFRLATDHALINRMGFNNDGVDALVDRLKVKGKPKGVIIGGNIGKNKSTPNESAVEDYEYCFDKLFPWVDYFVVNVSSPNTPGLRDLQEKEPLTHLLIHLQAKNQLTGKPKPILLKIAPDLTDTQLDDILEIVEQTNLAGVIATNTTISRENLKTNSHLVEKIGNGGLSGQPLFERSTEVIRYLSKASSGKLFIIGVGGIHCPEDAKVKLDAGASLVQLYTGLVYEGPSIVKRINQYLIEHSTE